MGTPARIAVAPHSRRTGTYLPAAFGDTLAEHYESPFGSSS